MLPFFLNITIRNTNYTDNESLLLLSWLVGKTKKILECLYMNNAEMQIWNAKSSNLLQNLEVKTAEAQNSLWKRSEITKTIS